MLPLAHETWFIHDQPEGDWGFAGETLTLVLLGAALAVTLLVRFVARRLPGVDIPLLGDLAPWMPFAVRMHLAVSLIGLLSLGVYLSPAMDLEANVVGISLGAVMAIVAVLMATGWKTRQAAILLVAAGPLGMLEFGFWDVVQRMDMLGLAVYVLVAGPGRWSADHEVGAARDPSPVDLARAVWVLRICAGAALIAVAFAEKLANPQLALDLLADKPQLNVAQEIGLGWSDLEFIRVAGAIEVLFGLLLISGALPQAVVVIAGIPFNATLWFFGTTELVGHLPTYGAMLVLLVYGSNRDVRPLVSSLWPRGAGRAADRTAAPREGPGTGAHKL
jgi:hypothetical protein